MLPEVISKVCQNTQLLCLGLVLPGALQPGALAATEGWGGDSNSTSFLLLPARAVQVAPSLTFTEQVVKTH